MIYGVQADESIDNAIFQWQLGYIALDINAFVSQLGDPAALSASSETSQQIRLSKFAE